MKPRNCVSNSKKNWRAWKRRSFLTPECYKGIKIGSMLAHDPEKWEPIFGTKIMRKQYVSNAQRLNLKGMRSNRNGEAD